MQVKDDLDKLYYQKDLRCFIMAINPLYNSSTIRLMGLASGLDTESIIQQTLRLHQMKIDSQFRARTLLEWRQQSLNSIKDELTNFRYSFLTALGSNAMRTSSAYVSTVASLRGKNSGAVTIGTTINSSVGTMRIGQIKSLATNTNVSSSKPVSKSGNGFVLTDKLGDLKVDKGKFEFDSSGNATVNINGKDIIINETDSIDIINDKLRGAVHTPYDPSKLTVETTGLSAGVVMQVRDENDKALFEVRDNGTNFELWDVGGLTDKKLFEAQDGHEIGLNGNKFFFATDGAKRFTLNDDLLVDLNNNVYTKGAAVLERSVGDPFLLRDKNGVQYTLNSNNTVTRNSDGALIYNVEANAVTGGFDFKDPFSGKTVFTADEESDAFYQRDYLGDTFGGRYTFDGIGEIRDSNGSLAFTVDSSDGVFEVQKNYIKDINTTTYSGITNGLFQDDSLVDYAGRQYDKVTINGMQMVLYKDEVTFGGSSGGWDANRLQRIFDDTVISLDDDGNQKFTFFESPFVWYNPGDTNSSYGETNVEINGISIKLTKDMSIDDMIKKVNGSGAGVTMSYDRLSDQFKLESDIVGPDQTIKVKGLKGLGIEDGTYNNGTYAEVQINGEWFVRPTNTISYRGVNITLNEITPEGEEETVVSLSRNSDEAVDRIKTFIDAYNVIINKLENLLKETKNTSERTYTPLTDEEKSVMSEKQIEDWEAIAKKGLLKNDAGIQNLINNLRGALFEQVQAAGLTPSQIGLSTGRWDSGTGSQIIIDEDILRAALESDPEKVANVFMGGADLTQSAGKGLLWRMEELMNGYINGSQNATITNLENSIKRTNEQMEKLQIKMYEEEDKLYKKFAALETALSKIQSQTDWMKSMLDSMNTK